MSFKYTLSFDLCVCVCVFVCVCVCVCVFLCVYVGLRYRILNPRGGIDRVAGGTRTSAPMASATRFRSYMAYVARAGHVDRGLSFENDTFQPPGKNGRGSTYIGRIR
jgi:hypothetical protein